MTESTSSTTRWDEYSDAGRQALTRGDLAAASAAFRAALEDAEATGPDSPRLAASLSSLAQVRYQAKDYAESAALFARALALRERLLGVDHGGVAQTLNNLAAVHVALGALDAAEPLLVRALAITERHRGPTHPDVSVNLNNLAKLHVKRTEHARAEPLLERLLDLERRADPRSPRVAGALGSLAAVKVALGAPAQAEELLRQAVALRTDARLPEDTAFASLLESLADACVAQGRLEQAIVERERALALRLQLVGGEHPTVAAARARLAGLRRRATPAAAVRAVTPASTPSAIEARPTRDSALDFMSVADEEPTSSPAAEAPAPITARTPVPAPMPRLSQPLPPNPWLAESEPPSVLRAETGEQAVTPAPAPEGHRIEPSTTQEPIAPPPRYEAPLPLPPLVIPTPVKREFDDAWGREAGEGAGSEPQGVHGAHGMHGMHGMHGKHGDPAQLPEPSVRPLSFAAPPVAVDPTSAMEESVAPLPMPTPMAVSMPVGTPVPMPVSPAFPPEPEAVPRAAARTPAASPSSSAAPAEARPARSRPAPRKPRIQPIGAEPSSGRGRVLVAAIVVGLVAGGGWLALGRAGSRGAGERATVLPAVSAELPASFDAAPLEQDDAAPEPAVPAEAAAPALDSSFTAVEDVIESSPVPPARMERPTPARRTPAAPTAAARPPRMPVIKMDQLTGRIDSATKAKVDATLRPKVEAPTFGARTSP